ncbi:MAG: DUF1648 domain-containing protein [Promicromonosporaceae bacterium]|nr:DUF1648 domain-containing protein [Promicromonosporaceae bacterium]
MNTLTITPRRHQALGAALAAIAAAFIILFSAGAYAFSWRDDLPNPIAQGWGTDGPNRFGSFGAFVGITLGVSAGVALLLGVLCWLLGREAITRRFFVGSIIWESIFASGLMLLLLAAQRGLSDAADASMNGWWIAALVVGPLLLAVIAGLLVPGDARQAATEPVPSDAPRLTLSADERAVWLGQARPGRFVFILLGVVIVGLIGLAIGLRLWGLLGAPVGLLGLVAGLSAINVRVDAKGLTVRGILGAPRVQIPADEIVRAAAIDLTNPLQYGGWGWRLNWRDGEVGTAIITRRGEALHVERTGGRGLVITVSDATTAAALLNTMADRAR